MKHTQLKHVREHLRNKRANTNVSLNKGKYSYEGNLALSKGELELIADKMALILDQYANLIGFGDTYNEICKILSEYNEYYSKSFDFYSKGGDWGMPVQTKSVRSKVIKSNVGDGVFGKSWDEIEKM